MVGNVAHGKRYTRIVMLCAPRPLHLGWIFKWLRDRRIFDDHPDAALTDVEHTRTILVTAVVAAAEDCDDTTIVAESYPIRLLLMSTNDVIEIVVREEHVNGLTPEGRDSWATRVFPETVLVQRGTDLRRIRPQKVTDELAVFPCLRIGICRLDLIESREIAFLQDVNPCVWTTEVLGDATMRAKNPVVKDTGERHVAEEAVDCLPYLSAKIFPKDLQTLMLE